MTASAEQPDRMRWFHQARFGMFIHWGVYAIPARGEWVMYNESIPAREYAPLAQRFDPRRFDPDAWAALAKGAGMKYMVLTSRHHDGFSLFDSKVSDFTAPKTAAGRDLLAAYVRACRRAGLKVGFYYSLLDWRFPGYFGGPEKDPAGWEQCVRYWHAQVRELCTQYGKLDLLWYDGGWVPWTRGDRDSKSAPLEDPWRAKECNAMVRELQPHIIINNRSGTERASVPEDYDTPEQHVTASTGGRAWESCMTINDNWGYCAGDHNWKTTTQLIHNLVRCASGGGNYLLNVGPKADGAIPAPSVKRLQEIGEWMQVNGESIYGCGVAPFGAGASGLTTAKGNTVYVHVFYWPGEELYLPPVKARLLSARLLASGDKLKVDQRPDRVFLRGLPRQAPDRLDSVIVLKVEG